MARDTGPLGTLSSRDACRVPEEARLLAHARARGEGPAEARRRVRHPEARRDAACTTTSASSSTACSRAGRCRRGRASTRASKRLAVQVEDHPLEYGALRGRHPGGRVRRRHRAALGPRHVGARSAIRARGCAKGKLEFALHGEKLRGALDAGAHPRARRPRDAEQGWLLIKERDDDGARRGGVDVTEARPESVASGRDARRDRARARPRVALERAGEGASAAAGAGARTRPSAARRSAGRAARAHAARALPTFVAPQLATLVDGAAARATTGCTRSSSTATASCAASRTARVRLLSRNGKDWTERFPARRARRRRSCPCRRALLDGEVVGAPARRRDELPGAAERARRAREPATLVYFVFDLLHLDGCDLTRRAARGAQGGARATLLEAAPTAPTLRYSDHVVGQRATSSSAQACRMSLEGIVSKRRDAPYASGRGARLAQGQVPSRSRSSSSAASPSPRGTRRGSARCCSACTTTTASCATPARSAPASPARRGATCARRLDALERTTSPFATSRRRRRARTGCSPELVGEVEFTEWTADGRLRHPSFQGLREDKPAREVVRERPLAQTRAAGAGRRRRAHEAPGAPSAERRRGGARSPASASRIPTACSIREQGITKLDLARYYEAIADWILPHLRRPADDAGALPGGPRAASASTRSTSATWAPAALRPRARSRRRRRSASISWSTTSPALVGLVQIGVLEIHTWGARRRRLEQPDRLVFDLDPARRRAVARRRRGGARVRDAARGSSASRASSRRPAARACTWSCRIVRRAELGRVPGRSRAAVAESLAREAPEAFIARCPKARAAGHASSSTTCATAAARPPSRAYSTRARPGAPVSTPLALGRAVAAAPSDHYTIANLPRRLAGLRKDPWARYWTVRQELPAELTAGRG